MKALKELRKQKKVSIRQLSIKTGIARGYLSELERDVHDNPTIDVVCKLCKVLGCTPNDLIHCDDIKEEKN